MIVLNTNNLKKIIGPQEFPSHDSTKKIISESIKKIHTRNQGFYTVIDDTKTIKAIETYAKSVKGKYSDIVVLGIGGSALGTICLEQSLTHLFQKELNKPTSALPSYGGRGKKPKLHVLDNIDPVLMTEILDVINLKKTLFIVVTKSGGTPETLAQYFYFRKIIDGKKLHAKKHFVFITDEKKGLLRQIATEENIPSFTIPENVGGRFSVQTAVGLLPAALIGINIKKLLAGLQSMRDKFLSEKFETNLPFQLASIQYLLAQKGKHINVLMPYAQKLIRLADWYRQLLAESIGKEKMMNGEVSNVGITPVNALGVTDQHSQNQLYVQGPNDKFLMFIEVQKLGKEIKIPLLYPKDPAVSYLKNVSFNKLINTELRGTADALTHNNRPNITIKIDAINEFTLGELFMLFEGATAFLGEFFEVNAFDQPGVELSKQLTKEYLLKR